MTFQVSIFLFHFHQSKIVALICSTSELLKNPPFVIAGAVQKVIASGAKQSESVFLSLNREIASSPDFVGILAKTI